MKIDDIFKKFSDAYSHSYEGERTVEDITEDLRHTLQFNDTPSFTDMQNGIVDCVGASVIASMVLTHFFKERAFCVVSLPGVPWLHESFWESKHTGVLEVLENEDVRIIDPTPINGYGYGTITKYFERKSLKKSGAGYKIVHTPDITDVEEWERYVYPYFQELSEQDVMDILAVDHCRSSLSEKPDYSTLKDLPKGTPGWAKDFLRLKAREFVRDGQI